MVGRIGPLGYLASASLLALLIAGPARAETWTASIDGLGQAGSEGGGGALDLLVPLYQDADTLLFTNLLGGLDSDSAKAAALGLVLRQRFDAGFILGGYGYLDFQRSADSLAQNARDKNVDAAALSYMKLTLTCVECHKYVRETRNPKP